MKLRMDNINAQVIRRHAAFRGISSSDFLQEAKFEKDDDSWDLADLNAAVAADDGRRFSLAEVRCQLGL